MKTYQNYVTDISRIINNSLPDNVAWAMETINDTTRYLVSKYYMNERTYTTLSVAQQQFYNLPPQVKKIINVTVDIGNIKWQPKECPTRQFWDTLNVQTAWYQDYPSYFFIYDGKIGIYPTPAGSGNTITLNYKTRIPDLSQSDYIIGSASVTSAQAIVQGTATTWTKAMADGGWIKIAHSATDANNGDDQWYQINSVTDATHLTLKNNYTGATVSGASYKIGQVSILPEDYQDLPLYRMAIIYYTTRFPDATKAGLYQNLYDDGEARLNEEFGSKTSSVILEDTNGQIINPNLFQRNVG